MCSSDLEENNAMSERDDRGSQPGETSEGLCIRDLTIHVPADANLDGIGRFYRDVLGAEVLVDEDDGTKGSSAAIRIRMGPLQTLTFVPRESVHPNTHVDLREIRNDDDDGTIVGPSSGTSTHLGNYGVHVSLYVADLPACYRRASELGLTYVNARFSRRAYTLEEAVDD